jgi:hypothetical protein
MERPANHFVVTLLVLLGQRPAALGLDGGSGTS